jgi:hypothetical protein
MRGLASPPRLPKLKGAAKAPTGERFVPKISTTLTGPGEPPPGFINGQNSLTEWVAYWALFKIYGQSTDDPRRSPFYGLYPYFQYQSSELGGFTRALGSAVVDFVVFLGRTTLGIRIQTERFHIFTDNRKQASDSLQRAQLEASGMQVIDVYDVDLLPIADGQKAVVTMKRAVGLLESPNPLVSGTAYRASRLRTFK